MSVDEIARHYNNVQNKDLNERTASRIFFQRNFNNWMKSMLIQEATSLCMQNQSTGMFVILDICCGKGGDLLKWHKAEVDEIVLVDIAAESVKQCETRYIEMRNRPQNHAQFGAHFITMDCTEENLFDKLPRDTMLFDIVSCQFALHYAFRSEKALRQMLYNISAGLRKGGYFIGTLPDAERIVHLLRKTTDGKFRNDVLSIEYIDKTSNWSTLQPPLFGAKIYFSLDEQVNCPEFLAYFPLLEEVCKDFDLELVSCKNFSDAIQSYDKNDQRNLMTRMKALEEYPFEEDRLNHMRETLSGARKFSSEYAHVERKRHEMASSGDRRNNNGCLGTLSKSEWEVVAIYQTFIFRKI
uniref:mRNA cap guanine-N7 methyltransferase n=1 Tax=Panagrolaimus sp. PS1159 TaxID=55785 RepID=A0AC35F3K3_9BILA